MNDFENIPLAKQPKNVTKILFKHQLSSIYQMETLEREKHVQCNDGFKQTRIGINADTTGYGKTLSMIGLIARDKMEWNLDIPFTKEIINTESAGLILNHKFERYDKIPTTLILVPTSIVSQWEKEFLHTNLRVKVIETRKDVETVVAENYDVVIVTVSMFNNLAISYSRYAWKRFIFDEPGHVRVASMKEINAGFYWLVTATPEDIKLRHLNCTNSFMKKIIGDEICKIEEQFEHMIVRNDLSFVYSSFNIYQTQHHYHKCFQPILKAVSGMINNTIHLMIEAGNIEGAVIALGGKKSDNILELVKRDILESLTKIEANILIYRDIKKDDKKLQIAMTNAEELKNKLKQLESRFESMLKDICPICTDTLKSPIMEPSCQNLFCGKCLLVWLQNQKSCPLCRANINNTELVCIENKLSSSTNQICKEKKYTHIEKVIDILNSNTKGKFIIFSAYDATFKPICKMLKEQNITFSLIIGNRKTREKNIENFKNGNTKVIFLNSNFNGAGINLQEASDIILYHEMTLSVQNQIIGRANRIGRSESLNVHHLQVEI
jgi:SNF2 family DNA or RNA helicase